MPTPEGRVKAQVKKILTARGPRLKAFWPVQNGMGAATIDCHVCYLGFYVVIETKAPGGKATPRQVNTLDEYMKAGAISLVIDSMDSTYLRLLETLDLIEGWHRHLKQTIGALHERFREQGCMTFG